MNSYDVEIKGDEVLLDLRGKDGAFQGKAIIDRGTFEMHKYTIMKYSWAFQDTTGVNCTVGPLGNKIILSRVLRGLQNPHTFKSISSNRVLFLNGNKKDLRVSNMVISEHKGRTNSVLAI